MDRIIETARSLSLYVGMGAEEPNPDVKKELDAICQGRSYYASSKDIALRCIEMVGHIDSVDAQRIVYNVCHVLGAPYAEMRLDAARRVAELSNGDAWSLYWLGLEHYKANQLDEAEFCLIQSQALNRYNALSARFMAKTYVKMNDLDKAISFLADYIERVIPTIPESKTEAERNYGLALAIEARSIIDATPIDVIRGYEFKEALQQKYKLPLHRDEAMKIMHNELEDIKKKKARGYVFRPRKKG